MTYDIKKLKEFQLTDYLQSLGFEPVSQSGSRLLYFSPLHPENTPSFWIDTATNTYKDFGLDELGGDVIDLVQKIEKLSRKQAFGRVHVMKNNRESIDVLERATYKEKPKKKAMVLNARPLESEYLIKYCQSRGIDEKIAKLYLYQVQYLNPDDKKFIAVGMVNNKGGYEIRSKYGDKGFKACIGEKTYSIIAQRPQSNKLYLFEGMFDFLSMMQIKKVTNRSDIGADCIVLNSLSCLSHVNFNAYKQIILFLDNDDAGKKAAEKIQKENSVIEFQDMAKTYYPNHKDLNEFLLCHQSPKK